MFSLVRNSGKHRIRARDSNALAPKSRNSNVLVQKLWNSDCSLSKHTTRNFRHSVFASKRIRNFRRRKFRNFFSGFRGGSATLCLCMYVTHLARSCERELRAWWRCGTGVRARVIHTKAHRAPSTKKGDRGHDAQVLVALYHIHTSL